MNVGGRNAPSDRPQRLRSVRHDEAGVVMTAHPQRERVQIVLLGGFRVAVGGREVSDAEWPSRRSAELVALLALSDRYRLMREEVIEALWPHLPSDAGAANLRKAAHHAR